MNGAESFALARSLLGKQVEVTLSHDEHDGPQRIARGQLLALDDGGEVVVLDPAGFCHYCWPMLDIREADP